MTKRQLIEQIISINQTAEPSFLAGFDDTDLDEYLQHLRQAAQPRISGDRHRYDHYFENCNVVSLAAPAEAETKAVEEIDQSDRDRLDLNVSESAYFNDSYEILALEDGSDGADQDNETGDERVPVKAETESCLDEAEEEPETWLF